MLKRLNLPELAVLLACVFLTTFRLLSVPPGIETDEGTISYNAALISKSLRDQNGRRLPFFILSRDKVDWKQPTSIYLAAIYFKMFGTSLLTFKLVNVTLALTSLIILWATLRILFNPKAALVGSVVFITTPMVIISSRIGTEAFVPIFISSAWLLSLVLFRKYRRSRYLASAALFLGIGFYSYKGMRLILPPWIISMLIYIAYSNLRRFMEGKLSTKTFILQPLIFLFTLAPFFLIIPFLELKYPGSVFDRTQISLESYRHYAYYWFSNLNFSSLFVRGDIGRIFSVELFGTVLLGSLPLFLLGVKNATDKFTFFTFILIIYLISPVLFGMSGSLGYTHRLTAMIPLFVIIATLGFESYIKYIKNSKNNYGTGLTLRTLGILAAIFYTVNFYNFGKYYFYEYPRLNSTRDSFQNNLNRAFYTLSQEASLRHLPAYIQDGIYTLHWEGNKFFELAYFNTPLNIWKLGDPVPKPGILLTEIQQIAGTTEISGGLEPLHLLQSN